MTIYFKMFILLFLATISISLNSAPKLIPVENFAKHAQYQNIKISPDAKHLAFTYRKGNEVRLAIMNRKIKKITAKFDFGEWHQVVNFHWGNNERILLEVRKVVGFLDKKGGSVNLYSANVDGSGRRQIFKPQSSSYSFLSLLKGDDKNILVEKVHYKDYDVAKETYKSHVVKLNIYTGKINKYSGHPTEDASNHLLDKDDNIRLAVQFIPDGKSFGIGEYFIYVKSTQTNTWHRSKVVTKTGANFNFVGLSPNGKTAYVTTDKDSSTSSLYSVNLSNDKTTKLFEHEYIDIGGLVTAYDDTVLGYRYSPDYNEIRFINKNHPESKVLMSLMGSFPGQDVDFTSYTEDGNDAVVYVRSDTNPGEFYLYNFKNNTLEYLVSRMNWLKSEQLSEMLPIEYLSRDGVKIHGYLTYPKGKKAKNLPLIVNPHGGPYGPRDRWGFNTDVQFMASRGYAVLQMNFRGSGGFGTEFMQSGYRKWGREMQDDITDATLWAIKTGIADPDRICIYGGSYGGYASLMAVVKEPDLYKCALGYVGVYDLETMFTDGDSIQSKGGKRYLKHVLGENKDELRANSPAWNVSKIKAKLFIAHGEEDVRVPMAQYDILTKALDDANIPYQSMVRDEGHGYQKEQNRIDFYKAMEKFFENSIGQ